MFISVALLCAFFMGAAIQRGGTCLVAAVDEVLARRRAVRLFALVEAALWVTAVLLLARVFGLTDSMMRVGYPFTAGHAVAIGTVAGAALLGLGAVVNGACAFGTVARVGSGEWVYLVTPVGFVVAAALVPVLQSLAPALAAAPTTAGQAVSPVLAAPGWAVWLLAAALLLRLWRPGRQAVVTTFARRAARRGARRAAHDDALHHAATAVIGILFGFLLLAAGAWTYTDALGQLAQRMPMGLGLQLLLSAALFAGAVAAGQGNAPHVPISLGAVGRRFAGGALMGAGALLVPGSNDTLVLLGMPLLWPHAWLAFAVMASTIAMMLRAAQRRTLAADPA